MRFYPEWRCNTLFMLYRSPVTTPVHVKAPSSRSSRPRSLRKPPNNISGGLGSRRPTWTQFRPEGSYRRDLFKHLPDFSGTGTILLPCRVHKMHSSYSGSTIYVMPFWYMRRRRDRNLGAVRVRVW